MVSGNDGIIFKTDKDLNIILWDMNGECKITCDRLLLFLNLFKKNEPYSGNILGESYTVNNQYTIENYKLEPNKRYKVKLENYISGSYYGHGTVVYKLVELMN